MKKNALILLLSLAPAALAADVTGRFPAGTPYEEPAAHAPATESRMFARSIARDGAHASVELPATGTSSMIVWTIPARRGIGSAPVPTRLVTPTGATLQPGERGSQERGLRRFAIDAAETRDLDIPGGANEVLHVMHAAAASYRLEADLPPDVAGVTVVAAEPDSPIVLSTWAAPLSRQPGEPVMLHARLRDGEAAIEDARVTARLASPLGRAFDPVELTHAGDGLYTATLADLPEHAPGPWQVRFEADGVTAHGARFARTGSGELVAERGAARLGRVRTDVAGGALRVTLPADIAIAGTYRLDVIAARDGASVAWAEGVRQLATGAATLTIELPLADIGTADGLTLDVRLLGLDPMGVAGRVVSVVD